MRSVCRPTSPRFGCGARGGRDRRRLFSALAAAALALIPLGAPAKRRPTPSPSPAPTAIASPTPTPLSAAARVARLRTKIATLGARFPSHRGGDPAIGIAIFDLQYDRHVSLHGSVPFPLTNVSGLAIAFVAYRFADQNRLHLDDRAVVTHADVREGGASGGRFLPGISYPYWRLLRSVVADDDATATATVLRHVGGVRAVQAVLDRLGLGTLRLTSARGPEGSADAVAALLAGIAENRFLLLDATDEYLDALTHRTAGRQATIVTFPDGRRVVSVALFGPHVDDGTRTTSLAAVAHAVDVAFSP